MFQLTPQAITDPQVGHESKNIHPPSKSNKEMALYVGDKSTEWINEFLNRKYEEHVLSKASVLTPSFPSDTLPQVPEATASTACQQSIKDAAVPKTHDSAANHPHRYNETAESASSMESIEEGMSDEDYAPIDFTRATSEDLMTIRTLLCYDNHSPFKVEPNTDVEEKAKNGETSRPRDESNVSSVTQLLPDITQPLPLVDFPTFQQGRHVLQATSLPWIERSPLPWIPNFDELSIPSKERQSLDKCHFEGVADANSTIPWNGAPDGVEGNKVLAQRIFPMDLEHTKQWYCTLQESDICSQYPKILPRGTPAPKRVSFEAHEFITPRLLASPEVLTLQPTEEDHDNETDAVSKPESKRSKQGGSTKTASKKRQGETSKPRRATKKPRTTLPVRSTVLKASGNSSLLPSHDFSMLLTPPLPGKFHPISPVLSATDAVGPGSIFSGNSQGGECTPRSAPGQSSEAAPTTSRTFTPTSTQHRIWMNHYRDAEAFAKRKGHCCIPLTYPENPTLARWAKRQRFHYNNYIMGSGGAMTPKRIELLQAIGFSFEMVSSSWLTKLEKLKECARIHGTDVNSIPRLSRSSGARAKRSESEKLLLQLNTWATEQREQFQIYNSQGDKKSTLNSQKIQLLEAAGFDWTL